MAYSEPKSYLPAISGSKKNAFIVVAIIAFAVLSLIGSPFVYDEGNSGRYLLKVLKAADPALFPNDPVVDSLQRFDSTFYDLLAWLFQITSASPEMVEPVMHGLYVASKFLLFFLLYKVATTIVSDIWYFLLVALWATFTVSIPIGGIGIFEPAMRHSEVAFLLCLIALFCLFAKKFYGLFWLSIAGALLVHSIMTLHFVLVIAPAYFFWHWHNAQRRKPHVIGIGVFGLVLVLYVLFMAPPAMSPNEGALFLSRKGEMQHISPFSQPLTGWITLLVVASIGLLIWWFFDRPDSQNQQMSLIIVWGFVVGFGFSIVAVSVTSVRLAQFQPMRIFLWVWLLTNWLWLLQAYKQLRTGSVLGILMFGGTILFLLQSLYAFLMVTAVGIYVVLYVYEIHIKSIKHILPEVWARYSLIGMTGLVGLGWLVGQWFGLSSYFLRNLFPLPILLILTLLVYRFWSTSRQQGYLWIVLFVIVFIGASTYWQGKHISNADWQAVQLWSREHTHEDERFLTVPDIGNNFRTGAFRTTVSEPMSALAWVDPITETNLGVFISRVNEAQNNGKWNLVELMKLANEANANYIVVPHATPHHLSPVFQTDSILIFAVPENK